jgi:DNA-directed RNA polymerase subunit RPC12/RpoP
MPGATLIAPVDRREPSAHPESEPTYSCAKCGHALRESGLGRHRVYFEVTDARAEEREMGRVCPACRHDLPGTNRP